MSYHATTLTIVADGDGVQAAHDGRVRVALEVHGDQRLIGVGHDALQRPLGSLLEGSVHLFHAGLALQVRHEVNHRDGRRGHAEGHAVEAPLQLGDHQPDRAGGAGGRGDDVQACRAGVAQVLRRHVQQALRVGVGVDGGQQARLDAPAVVEHLGDRREAVGGAGGVGDDVVLGRVVLVLVHAEHDGDVLVLGGRRDDDLLHGVVQMRLRLGGVGEEAGALDDDLRAFLGPGNLRGILVREDANLLAVDRDVVVVHDLDGAIEAAVGGVVAEEVGVGRGVGNIVDRDDLDVVGMPLQDRLQALPADAAESVDAYTCRHCVCAPPR